MLTFCGVLKIIVIFFAVIAIVSIVIDRSPLHLLAGLGATSAVLMLVFKDTISGLVAGIRLTSNDMLHKGDWITVSKAGVNGVVDDITLTTVKVRNFDNTTVTITPQTLVDESFQNWNTMTQGEGRRVALLEDASWSAVAPEVGKVSSRQPVSAMVLAHIVPTSMFLNIVFIADVSFLIRMSH